MQQILEIPYFAVIESCSAKGRSGEDWLVARPDQTGDEASKTRAWQPEAVDWYRGGQTRLGIG